MIHVLDIYIYFDARRDLSWVLMMAGMIFIIHKDQKNTMFLIRKQVSGERRIYLKWDYEELFQ